MTWVLGVLAVVATLGAPLRAVADDALWEVIKAGGHVILMRHAITSPGVGDPPGFNLEDCATQRNLTDEGRAHARRVGEAFRARGVPVAQVLSSPWCRCLETARLAFGTPGEMSTALGNLFGRPEAREPQVRRLRPLLGAPRTDGNVVMVTHGSTIQAVTGINPATAEMVIVTPQGGDRFSVAGRLSVP
jgi:broad specificity phosphatase PhoE